jgi:SpoVK/Ycf46/Vps4 family AAA+-type ATPase
VIAATNRIDILDPALLRSGRLDRKIEFPLPDEKARAKILEIHSRKMTVEPGVNYPEIARSTDEFNGAQLKAVCVEAGMIALREGASKLSHEHFLSGIAEGARVARARGLGALTGCASASEEEERPHVLRVIQAFPAASLGCPCSIRTYRTLGALFCTANQGFEFFFGSLALLLPRRPRRSKVDARTRAPILLGLAVCCIDALVDNAQYMRRGRRQCH